MNLPYRPHYINDWLGSSIVRQMCFTAKGIYMELLDLQWTNGVLPENIDELRKICRCSAREWNRFNPFLEQTFPKTALGRQNIRCKNEREKWIKKYEIVRERNLKNGSKGGRPITHWEPTGILDEKPTGICKNNPLGTHWEPNQNQNQNQKQKIPEGEACDLPKPVDNVRPTNPEPLTVCPSDISNKQGDTEIKMPFKGTQVARSGVLNGNRGMIIGSIRKHGSLSDFQKSILNGLETREIEPKEEKIVQLRKNQVIAYRKAIKENRAPELDADVARFEQEALSLLKEI